MLVLTRSAGESVVIDAGGVKISVVVMSVDRGDVRLGFRAPREVIIHRLEIAERIRNARVTPEHDI